MKKRPPHSLGYFQDNPSLLADVESAKSSESKRSLKDLQKRIASLNLTVFEWRGRTSELAELLGILQETGWIDGAANLTQFFDRVALAFHKGGQKLNGHNLRVSYERSKYGSRKKPSIFEPLRKIKNSRKD
jgi:hypothetical protein